MSGVTEFVVLKAIRFATGEAETKLARARLLYVKAQTRRERAALDATEEYLRKRQSKLNERNLARARENLAAAERMAGEVFDAVMRGEVEP